MKADHRRAPKAGPKLPAAAALTMMLVAGASAAAAQDVVMRRPLPNRSSALVQTSTDPTTPPVTSTPATIPDREGLTTDTADDPTDAPAPNTYGYYEWEVGRWTGGQCGVASTATRAVSCVYTYYDSAQFLLVARSVSPDHCAERTELGPRPDNTYKGVGDGCEYKQSIDHYGPWDATCSSQARREIFYRCEDARGNRVSPTYCTEGLSAASYGLQETPAPYETGNYESCKYAWDYTYNDSRNFDSVQGTRVYGHGATFGSYCGVEGDRTGNGGSEGPHLYADLTTQCRRSDGAYVEESRCGSASKPQDGIQEVGSCHSAFHPEGGGYNDGYACKAAAGVTLLLTTSAANATYGGTDLACDAALTMGATCCAVRQRKTDRVNEVIATQGAPAYVGYGTSYADGGKTYVARSASAREYNYTSADCQVRSPLSGDAIYQMAYWHCY